MGRSQLEISEELQISNKNKDSVGRARNTRADRSESEAITAGGFQK